MQFLSKMKYPEVEEAVKNHLSVIVLPVGTVEEHGPHLPLDTDCFGAKEMAVDAGKILEKHGFNIIIAPAFPYGVCKSAMTFPGTITIEPETLERIIIEIIKSLDAHGFLNFVLVNQHGAKDHLVAIENAVKKLQGFIKGKVIACGTGLKQHPKEAKPAANWEKFMLGKHPELDWHAGEYETSVALFKRPELVNGQILGELSPVYVDLHKHWASGAKSFTDIPGGEKGYFGDPSAATAETGKKVYEVRVGFLAETIINFLKS